MPYAELAPDTGRIAITTTYADRYLIRQLPGANYRADSQTWRVPVSWAACITLRGLFGKDLEIGPDLTAWATAHRASRIEPVLRLRDKLRLDDDLLAVPEIGEVADMLGKVESADPGYGELFPYQRADVAFMVLNQHAILANPMGVGKTASAIRTMQVLAESGHDPFPALVVCPNTVKLTWAGELAKFAPRLGVSVIAGSAGQRRKALNAKADVYIINWEALRIHSRLAAYGAMALDESQRIPKELNKIGFRTVIGDEMHRIRDPHSQQTRAFWAIIHQAAYRYGLTGTPVVNDVGDLWSLLHAVEPEGFPAKTRYLDRWARVELSFYGGSEIIGIRPDTEAEFRAITNPMIRRIPKKAALPQLPEKLPVQYRFTEMTPAQSRLYKQMEREMIVTIQAAERAGEIITAANAITKLTRLMQFAAASAVTEKVTILKDGQRQEVTRIRLAPPSAKVDDLIDLLGEMGNEPLVVAAVSSQLINLAAAKLAKHGITHGLITGAQSAQDRQAAVEAFQAGKIRVMLLTIDAGGEGITLTRASTLLFMQRHWSTVKNQQCEDRLHRIGQKYPVQVIDQVTPGTVEYRKFQVIHEKDMRIEEILQDHQALARLLGM